MEVVGAPEDSAPEADETEAGGHAHVLTEKRRGAGQEPGQTGQQGWQVAGQLGRAGWPVAGQPGRHVCKDPTLQLDISTQVWGFVISILKLRILHLCRPKGNFHTRSL